MPRYLIDTDAGTCTVYGNAPVLPPTPPPPVVTPPVVTPPPVTPPVVPAGNWLMLELPWRSTGLDDRPVSNGFSEHNLIVLRIQVPPDAAGQSMTAVGFERIGGYVPRHAALSETPGSFASPLAEILNDGSPKFFLTAGTQPGWVTVQPGRTYYINIANRNGRGESTCPDGYSADMWFETTVR